ncbi:YqcC family protein [Ferrimonas pelagia]|uniref:YqcC family protein n=1 Tax=Ferrimonas pelagia TaxID=1177826 RepID=A0ABP9ELG1_9GAMM
MHDPKAIDKILDDIAALMQQLKLWQAGSPSAEALASQQPFCCDTLAFEQWLQFILLPRIKALLSAQAPLPTQVCICPMAEEAFKGRAEYRSLIDRIADLDQALSGKRVREQ